MTVSSNSQKDDSVPTSIIACLLGDGTCNGMQEKLHMQTKFMKAENSIRQSIETLYGDGYICKNNLIKYVRTTLQQPITKHSTHLAAGGLVCSARFLL